MGNNSSENSERLSNTSVIELTGKIMVVAIILLFFVIFFVFCLHLYAKWFWYRRQETTTTTRRRRRLDFAAGHQEITLVSPLRHGLDSSVLKTIPVLVFDSKELKDGLECAVCLCEVSEGEKIRLLPKCNHGFHVDCIDMWFQSHSTCPLCRNPVSNQSQSESASESPLEANIQAPILVENSGLDVSFYLAEGPNFPTNVLCWGNESQVSIFGHCLDEDHQVSNIAEPSSSSSSSMGSTSNRGDGLLAIDITRQMNEDEEQKSAVPTRLRSLKRLLSGTRRVNPSSVGNSDLEQGIRS